MRVELAVNDTTRVQVACGLGYLATNTNSRLDSVQLKIGQQIDGSERGGLSFLSYPMRSGLPFFTARRKSATETPLGALLTMV